MFFEVIHAWYGNANNYIDVTERVRQLSNGQSFTVKADYKVLRADPLPGKPKQLLLFYRAGRFHCQVLIPDGRALQMNGATHLRPRQIEEKVAAKQHGSDSAYPQLMTLIRHLLIERDVTWWLDYGTALGVVRGGNILSHDYDLDLGFLLRHPDEYPDLMEYLKTRLKHRTNVRVVDNKNLITVWDREAHCDLWAFEPKPDGSAYRMNTYANNLKFMPPGVKRFQMPAAFLKSIGNMPFLGELYPLPLPAEDFIRLRYGVTWTYPMAWELAIPIN